MTPGDPLGVLYDGKQNTTASGLACQKWSSHVPHASNVADFFSEARDTRTKTYRYRTERTLRSDQDPKNENLGPIGSLAKDHNYCRNPDWEEKPWCYTMNPSIRWEFCAVRNDSEGFKNWCPPLDGALDTNLSIWPIRK